MWLKFLFFVFGGIDVVLYLKFGGDIVVMLIVDFEVSEVCLCGDIDLFCS